MAYLAEQGKQDRDDEIWMLSHKPVYTLGQTGKPEHILDAGDIPVINIDRGGQVTYHGPGQLVVYLLLNMRRRGFGVRNLVDLIEKSIIDTLREFDVEAVTRQGAPGVYVNDAKISALGLRIKNGWSYHGLSLNVKMDLEPFSRINPCGFENLAVTQLVDLLGGGEVDGEPPLMQTVSTVLSNKLLSRLDYLPRPI
jgi:lipoyl(octanoyl) transferase